MKQFSYPLISMGLILFCSLIGTGGCVPEETASTGSSSLTGQTSDQQPNAQSISPESGGAPKTNTAVVERNDPYWKRALQEVYRSSEELQAQDARERRRGEVLPKLLRGNKSQKLIALTFDDGPHPEYTPKLLDILTKADVKATFFVIGKMVEKQPDLLKAIDAAGMEIGNHTFSHVTLTKIPKEEIITEYKANNDIVQKVTGKKMRFCRPPGGDYDADVISAATECGLTTVLWTDDPGDYASPGDNIIEQRTLQRLSNGGIILLHDGVKQALDVLPQIITYAKKQGFKFVTASELQKSLGARN